MSTGILLTGKRGEGKTLAAVGRIQQYLKNGRTVATNLDLNLEFMLHCTNKTAKVIRVPNHPSIHDLEALPLGNDTTDEEKNGILVLDEVATFLNARTWQKGDRQDVVSWLLHSRKYGWDLLMISQHQNLIDKQLRDSLFEFLGVTKRLDKIAVPFIGPIVKLLFSYNLRFPKVHIVTVKYGFEQGAPKADRWIYQAKGLYQAYDTRQIIHPDNSPAMYSVLPPWYTVGRYKTWWEIVKKYIFLGVFIGFALGAGSLYYYHKQTVKKAIFEIQNKEKPAAPVEERKFETQKITGYFKTPDGITITLDDGTIYIAEDYLMRNKGQSDLIAKAGGKWYEEKKEK